MDADDLRALLDEVAELARAAGEAIEDIRKEGTEVESKADGSPVTRADMAAHRAIVSGLASLELHCPVVSEEGEPEKDWPEDASLYWLVDPLDGTREFINGYPEYTVNVALVERGEPVLGVVHVPAAGVTYRAARGLGARRTDAHGAEERVRTTEHERPLTAAISRSHASREVQDLLERWGVENVIRRGSSLKMCAVAEGSADVYPRLGPTCLWDTAAGTAVVRQAGGRVSDLNGDPLSYSLSGGLKHRGFLVTAARLSPRRLLE